jgi:excisionase family DNA binding protein
MEKIDRALRVEEVAEQTGWRVPTVRAKILRREIAYVRLGRSVRILQSTVSKLISENTIPARPQVKA